MVSSRDNALAWPGLLILLVIGPLPLGSVSPLAQALLTFWVFALLASWATCHQAASSRWLEVGEGRLRVVLAIWTLAVALALFQIVPLPPRMIAALSPSVYDLYGWTLPNDGQGVAWRALSATPAATLQSGLLIGACGATFFLASRLCRTQERSLVLALTVLLVGAGEAIYGLAQLGGSLTRPASGTFVNRNHFSAYLAMALCLCVGLLLSQWQRGQVAEPQEGSEPEPWLRLERWARGSPLIVVTLMLLAGLLFSFSRMGLTAPALMLVLFGLFWLFGPVSRRTRLIGSGIVVVTLLLVGGAWPALEVVAERFQSLEDTYRMAAWEGTYALFQSSPILGIGLGGLVDHLPRFLPDTVQGIFDHSHNEVLEVLAEGGVLYAGLLGIGLVVYFGTVIPAWFARRDPFARGLGLGAMAGTAAVLLHSLVDFPLRMPANALCLSAIMGLGWATIHARAELGSRGRCESLGVERSSHFFKRAIILVLAIGGVSLSAVAGVAETLDRAGDGFVRRATEATGETRRALLQKATHLYQRANQIEAWHPTHAYKLGRASELTAAMRPPLSEEARVKRASAAMSYGRAVRLHPANPRLQATLAWAALRSGDLATGRRAAKAALKLAPHDAEVRFAVSRWYLIQWNALDDEAQRLATSLVQRGARERPQQYVEAAWRLVRDPQTVRFILPDDAPARRLLLAKLTEGQLFSDRWAEQAAYPALQTPLPKKGIRMLSHGRLTGRQVPPPEAAQAGSWTGMVEGRLSGGLTAKLDLVLPPGEVVLYIPILGEAAGGIWPTLTMHLGGKQVPLPAISGPGWRAAVVHLSTRGGTFPLKAVLTNAAVIMENGQFIERHAVLGRVRILSPQLNATDAIDSIDSLDATTR